MKKILGQLLKLGLALGIIGWLVYKAAQKPEFGQVLREPKRLGADRRRFWAAVRRRLSLLRPLASAGADARFSIHAEGRVRLSFLGYLFNFVGPAASAATW